MGKGEGRYPCCEDTSPLDPSRPHGVQVVVGSFLVMGIIAARKRVYVLLVLTRSATQARRNYAENQPHVESVARNKALSVPSVHMADFNHLSSRRATTTLQVLI